MMVMDRVTSVALDMMSPSSFLVQVKQPWVLTWTHAMTVTEEAVICPFRGM